MPRPAWRWVPKYRQTYGDLAARLGEQIGLPPDEDQRDVLDAIFAVGPAGRPVCFEVGVIAPRQNLKTATLEIAALTDLLILEEPLHIWTAHLYDTAQKTYADMKRRLVAVPDLRERVKFRDANGEQSIELVDGGGRIEFHARSKGAGRGVTGSKITLDEALYLSPGDVGSLLPTLATVADAQVRYGSSAGLESSQVLRGIRNRGRAGKAESLAYFEWSAPPTPCGQDFCSHLPGTTGCALDDPALLRAANPAYGRRISPERLQQFRDAMPPEEFAREFLGWWEDPPDEGDLAIPYGDWAACLDAGSRFGPGPVGLGVHLTGDRSAAFVAGAGLRDDGLLHVEVLAVVAPSRAVGALKELSARRGTAVALDPGSHAGSLAQPLEAEGVEVLQVSLQKISAACGALYDAVTTKGLRHIGQPDLDLAVKSSIRKPVGRDAWVWRGSGVTPLMAATLALHELGDAVRPSVYEERGLTVL